MPGTAPHPIVAALIAESGRAARIAQAEAAKAGARAWLAPVAIRFEWLGGPPAGVPEIVAARLIVGDAAGRRTEGAGDGG